MRLARTFRAASLALGLAGCATHPTGTSPGIGWRSAVVLETGPGEALGPPRPFDCRRRRADARGEERTYALVQYFAGRTAHSTIVPLAPGDSVAVGDTIWVRAVGCAAARVS